MYPAILFWPAEFLLKDQLLSVWGFPCMLLVASPLSGAALGITDKMEARPQPPLLISQAWPRDEGVRPCDSDLFFPSWLERMLRCLREA